MDTTLGSPPERGVRVAGHLTAICVAGVLLEAPRTFALPNGAFEIGRAAGPEALGLGGDPRLSRRHARVARDKQGALSIEALGASPVEVNGVELREGALADGDVIVVGETALVVRLTDGPRDAPAIDGLIGDAPSIRAIRRSIAKVATAPMSVVLLGESGTGKEVVARALHERSGRKGDLVALNCAAIPATLAEAQLFGHAAGAFTGAQRASPGVFRAASGGTLFLDEIGDLPLELQPKLLRALEERAVVAVGTTTSTPVDVRVVAATHRDLIEEVRAGRFRGDLYARLAEFTIELPRLRDRREDILPILAHLVPGKLPRFAFDALRALLVHPWPFNVRELRTVAAHLQLLDPSDAPVSLREIGDRLVDTARVAAAPAVATPPSTPPEPERRSPSASASDRAQPPSRAELEALLRTHRGNVTELARASGRSRKQVYRWLESHGLDAERFRAG
jgi:DNA-binding NtrC family response regulator